MRSFKLVLPLLLFLPLIAKAEECQEPHLLSCSLDVGLEKEPQRCCVSYPAGLFSYTQTWDTTQGKWLSGHLRLLRCDGAEYRCEAESSRLLDSQSVARHLGHAGDHTEDGKPRISLGTGTDVDQYVAEQWSGSGACISTLAPHCTTSDTQFGIRLFYRALDALSTRLDNSNFLAVKGIYNSLSRTYTRDRLLEALNDGSSLHPAIECDGDILRHVEYRFIARGPFQDLQFEAPRSSWSSRENHTACPVQGIRYLPSDFATVLSSSTESPPTVTDAKGPTVNKLKFFKHRHGQRMPEEHVWKPETEETQESHPRHDEL